MQASFGRATRRGLILAASIAVLGSVAVSIECGISFHKSFAEGRGLATALLLFLRYFTILTNIGIAALMTVTAWRLAQRKPPAPASLYAAGLVYIVVVGITYEAMLRRLWSPQGVQFYTDMTMHDVIPVLSLVFWVAFAPKAPLAWSGPLRWLEFPAVYFAATLMVGLIGADYPYGFLDPDKLGYAIVLRNGLIFLAAFYGLGLGVVATARVLTRERRALRATGRATQEP
ncbi:Pr6Pr family membrane protein [Beijerinckia sp. L45]|uniref:Pr6Pr family membrane protein n=1 Tax=Beijerinckia sp. L45 TaxID=1641855 RepID=UPI00131EC0ED|nr:Pr6Pr family membrane protein [Beijerinckia sp. L45]